MIKEIKFLVTGEYRAPRAGDWFLGAQDRPILAAHDFVTCKFPILKMEVTKDREEECGLLETGISRA